MLAASSQIDASDAEPAIVLHNLHKQAGLLCLLLAKAQRQNNFVWKVIFKTLGESDDGIS